jgi:two-component system, LytTR family, sensor kinase
MVKTQRIKLFGVLIFFMINEAGGGFNVGNSTLQKIIYGLLIIAIFYLVWSLAVYITGYYRNRFSGTRLIRKRVLRSLAAISVTTFALFISFGYIVDHILHFSNPYKNIPFEHIAFMQLIQSIFLSACMTAILEANSTIASLRKSEKEKDELQKANLQSRFDSLKGQVNPHFLFNSLNTLSSLISKDPARAEAFVEELSSVYRYLLRSNEQELTPLREEINFIHSFVHLLGTRFGEGFKVNIQVAEGYHEYQLPPLTLQMLVENAVKHNIISKDEPLCLQIFTTADDRLHVSNNLQRKTREVLSEKVGLNNIIERYKLLNHHSVEIKDTGDEFTVTVPLIKPAAVQTELPKMNKSAIS